MNIFRLVGDVSHMLAFVCLMLQLHQSKNARGISLKTQELRLVVFVCRYLDLFTTFYSLYNSIVKAAYINFTAGIIIAIRYTEPMYNYEQDSFPHWKYCAAPCFGIAFVVHLVGSGLSFYVMEYLWTASIFLESVAIIPQLVLLRKYRLVEKWTGRFLFFLGTYRGWYILNWWYRWTTEPHYRHQFVVYFCGVVQVLVFGDYLSQYCRLSRWCGFRRRRRNAEEGDDRDPTNDDDDDDNELVFEMSRDTSSNDTSAVEPLLVQNGEPRRRNLDGP